MSAQWGSRGLIGVPSEVVRLYGYHEMGRRVESRMAFWSGLGTVPG